MSHRIDLFYPEAPSGSWTIVKHGTATPATAYTDYNCQVVKAGRALTAAGRDGFFVTELVEIKVFTAAAVQVADIEDGVGGACVMMESNSLTGTSPSTGLQVTGGRLLLDAAFNKMITSFGGIDFKVQETGTGSSVFLKDALANVRSNNSQLFNVKQPPYNAVGDGVTNDDAAVQAAYTALAANGGGTLYFPTGDYLLSQTIVVAVLGSATVLGDGLDASRIISSNATALISFLAGDDAIRDIGLDCLVDNSIILNAQNCTSFTVERCRFNGGPGPNSNRILLTDVFRFSIDRCRIENTSTAALGQIALAPTSFGMSGHITNNWFDAIGWAAVRITGGDRIILTVTGNNFINGVAFAYVDVTSASADSQLTVSGNTFDLPDTADAIVNVTASLGMDVMEGDNAVCRNTGAAFMNPIVLAGTSTGAVVSRSQKPIVSGGTGASAAPRISASVTTIVANANFTLLLPVLANGSTAANPWNGAEVTAQIHNSTGGNITMALTAGYHGTTTVLAAATTRTYRFRYNNTGTVSGWIQQGAIIDVT